jgi:hypothetical protein
MNRPLQNVGGTLILIFICLGGSILLENTP